MLTHANCFWTNLAFDLATGLTGDDVVLQVLPQFHCGGWNVQPLLAWWKGGKVVLERVVRAGARARAARREARDDDDGRAGDLPLPLAGAGFADADLSSLRLAVVGGAPMPEELIAHVAGARDRDRPGLRADRGGAERALPAARGRDAQDGLGRQAVPVRRGRGSATRRAAGARAERLPRLLAQPRGDGRRCFATAGCTPATWPRCDDEGCYRIRGRLKDMYISGGENVYPAEVESVSTSMPAVADAAVVGVPDERWGEVGVAFVVAEEPVERGGAARALPRAAREVQGAEARAVRRRAADVRDEQGAEGRAARARRSGGAGVTDLAAPLPTGVDGQGAHEPRRARRASACSRRPRASSPSSATTTRRSSRSPRRRASRRARSTSTSRASRRSSRSSCAT